MQTRVAQQFAEQGPRDLKNLLASTEEKTFSSFEDFKKVGFYKYVGPAGDGYEYHHIVEQGPQNANIPQELLQSTQNIVRVPKLLHEEITAEYQRSRISGLGSLRSRLSNRPYNEQYSAGLTVLRRLGYLK
jgi:hypothetical protein